MWLVMHFTGGILKHEFPIYNIETVSNNHRCKFCGGFMLHYTYEVVVVHMWPPSNTVKSINWLKQYYNSKYRTFQMALSFVLHEQKPILYPAQKYAHCIPNVYIYWIMFVTIVYETFAHWTQRVNVYSAVILCTLCLRHLYAMCRLVTLKS